MISIRKSANKRQPGAKARKRFPRPKTTKTASSSPSETHIFVLGPRKLHNQLLCSFIESETGVKCTSAQKAYRLSPIARRKNIGKTFLIVDCEGKASATYLNKLQSQFPNTIICLYNAGEQDNWAAQLIKKVHGVFHENDSIDHLIMGINAVIAGRLWLPRKILEDQIFINNKLPRTNTNLPLTSKETEILLMVSKGASNQQVADKLGIKRNTVKGHLYHVYKKLKVENRTQATLWASEHLQV
jgi:LuxR family transcriptional regulator of csgAB operon